jgi:hypothetical protein
MFQNINSNDARKLNEKIDFGAISDYVNEKYGYVATTKTNMVESWSGQALDPGHAGYLYAQSDYVGMILKEDDKFYVLYNRGENHKGNDVQPLPLKSKESNMHINEPMFAGADNITKDQVDKLRQALDNKEIPMHTNLTAHLCNTFYKGKDPIYYIQETMINVSGDNAKIKAEFQKVIENDDYTVMIFKDGKPVPVVRNKQAVVVQGFENGKSVIILKGQAAWVTNVDIRENTNKKEA